ncbi:MAG: DUF2905 domain-containing protein [Acidobacteriaceae bacterium]|nr:DUF2905 domain-containing protein [Acidobacteriaceae bacterium]
MLAGALLLVLGVLLSLGDKLPIRPGRLPGDVVYRGKNTIFYFPWVTCLLLSVLFSLMLWLFNRR